MISFMIKINNICDTFKNKNDSQAFRIYYFNLKYEKIWQKLYYHYDTLTTSKICYYEGVPLTRSKKFVQKEFYENSYLKSICSFVDGKINSPDDDLPALIEYSLDGNMCLEVFNENLNTDIVIEY